MVFTEGRHTAEFLLTEADGNLSRDIAIIAKGPARLSAGTVLTYLNGKYDVAAIEQPAHAVLYAHVDPTLNDVPATIISRSAELIGEALIFAPDITQNERATQIAQLANYHLIVR